MTMFSVSNASKEPRINFWAIKESAIDLIYKVLDPIEKFLRRVKIPFTRGRVKTIFVRSGGRASHIYCCKFIRGVFKWKNGESAKRITIDLDNRAWRMIYCHEVAHILTLHLFKQDEYFDPRKALRAEIIAWRLSKSFCKEKYWNEELAIECLLAHTESFPNIVNADKLRKVGIISLNKGVRIPRIPSLTESPK